MGWGRTIAAPTRTRMADQWRETAADDVAELFPPLADYSVIIGSFTSVTLDLECGNGDRGEEQVLEEFWKSIEKSLSVKSILNGFA